MRKPKLYKGYSGGPKSIPESLRKHLRRIGSKGGKSQPRAAKVLGGKNSWKARLKQYEER